MLPAAAIVAFKIVTFMAAHRSDVAQLIHDVQALMQGAKGDAKRAAVRDMIGTAMGLGQEEVEKAWPAATSVFNLFVAEVKGSPAPAPTPAA